MDLNNSQKQTIINNVTQEFKRRQWFNGCGFDGNKLIIAYNFYPAFELVNFKTEMIKYGVEYELKDIRVVMPGSQKSDIPPYIRET
jgi:hypothetical protein